MAKHLKTAYFNSMPFTTICVAQYVTFVTVKSTVSCFQSSGGSRGLLECCQVLWEPYWGRSTSTRRRM